MVAISLYKGNLHKVPDVPHRWPRPTPTISLKDFKILLRRRARALSRLRPSTTDNVGTISSPNPSSAADPNPTSTDNDPSPADNLVNNNGGDNHVDNICSESELQPTGDLKEGEVKKEKVDEKLVEGEDSLRKLMEKTDALVKEEKNEENVTSDDKTEVPMNPAVEKSNAEDATSDVEKRKKEVKEKLEILNEKKHSLVQVLKQILNAEEQLKRQNSVQGLSGRPPLPLQVDTATDSGSMTRVNTPRTGADGNPCGEMEGGEADDVSNNNMLSRHLPRMNSTSPSSDSQQRKPASNMVAHSYRTTLGVAGSPSRFAPAGQGQSSVSVSGASYIASSPSPAASGGTSVFRDARLPSPWN
ncbi:hypothetical protein CDL12_28332 [Handroanthus impetiginosus]|uniref:Uncharacterized protein n=1 Tax=Handroanthus impetiginosus TaxID=429701 RepID=A0A2G9G1H3_9LAMI|nr:hypothetical protein CDL12_28332 [Handroanthus impetiginosus]